MWEGFPYNRAVAKGQDGGVEGDGFGSWLKAIGAAEVEQTFRDWLSELYDREGPVGDARVWLVVRDRQLELAAWACELVNGDIARTAGCNGRAAPLALDYGDGELVEVEFEGSYQGSALMGVDPAEVLLQVADKVQVQVMGNREPWPTCDPHDAGVHAELREGRAVWWCRWGDHLVAEVGKLLR